MHTGMTNKLAAATLAVVLGYTTPAQATTYYWSGATNANMSGTAGNWGGTVPGALDIATWDAVAYTNAPTANAAMTLGGLLFTANNAAGVTFGAGTGTLTLNGVSGVGIQVDSGSGTNNTGTKANFKVGASQGWVNNSVNPLTIGGTIANSDNTTPKTLTIDGTGNTTLGGVISDGGTAGTLAITKMGLGKLTVPSSSNPFSGGLNVYAGTVQQGYNNNTLGAGTISLGDTTPGNTNNATITLIRPSGSDAAPIVVNAGSSGTLAIISTYASGGNGYYFTLSGGVTLNHDLTLALTGQNKADVLLLSGNISGGSGLKIGDSNYVNQGGTSVKLSGTNTYTGGLVVNSGTVNLLNDQSAATGSLALGITNGLATTLNIGSASQTATTSAKVGAANFVQVGANTAVGVGTGAQKLNVVGTNGFLTTVNNDGTLWAGRTSTVTIGNYSTWNQNNSMTIQAQGGYSATLLVITNGTFTYAGSTAINVQPGGSLNGDAFVTIAGGTFRTAQGFNLGSGGTPLNRYGIITLSGGGILRLSASIPSLTTVGSTGKFQLGTGGGTFDTAGFDTTLGTALTNVSAQIGSLTKTGAGTLALTNAIYYSGATTVSNGILDVSSAPTFASTNWIIAASGTLKVGTTALSVKNLAVGVDGTGAGLLDVTGNLTLGGNLTVTGTSTGARKIAKSTGTISGTFGTTSLPSGYVLTSRNSNTELWVGYPSGTMIRFF